MIVLKFGGSSIRNADWIRRAFSIVRSRLHAAPVVVLSAMGSTTDSLASLFDLAESGRVGEALRAARSVCGWHRDVLSDLGVHPPAVESVAAIEQELSATIAATAERVVERPALKDVVLSAGERLSTSVFCAYANVEGFEAFEADSRSLVVTDRSFGAAAVDFASTYTRISDSVVPRAGSLVVVQGFIGSTDDGAVTTLGRGGSDYSATIYGAALDAEAVEIWTDVDGVMTADPRLEPDARPVQELSYAEAAELAYFGGKVLHPATMVPAVQREMPLVVGNTARPDGPRTRISAAPASRGVRAVSGRAGVTILTVFSSRMLNAHGFLREMFAAFDECAVSVDIVATSEVSVSASVDLRSPPDRLLRRLEGLGRVQVESDLAIVSVIGEDQWSDAERVASALGAIGGAVSKDAPGLKMISLGSSDTNLSLVVPSGSFLAVVRSLHAAFFCP